MHYTVMYSAAIHCNVQCCTTVHFTVQYLPNVRSVQLFHGLGGLLAGNIEDWDLEIIKIDFLSPSNQERWSEYCRSSDFQYLPIQKMIEEIWLGSIFGMLIAWMVGRLQRWGIKDVQVIQSFSRDGNPIQSIMLKC